VLPWTGEPAARSKIAPDEDLLKMPLTLSTIPQLLQNALIRKTQGVAIFD
jgi:hypothetical protein